MAEGERAITYRGVVKAEHCDHMGHMNVMWYVGKFDEASWQMFAAMGLTRSRMQKEKRGVAGVEQRIEYKRELSLPLPAELRERASRMITEAKSPK